MDKTLESAFDISGDVLPPERAQQFERLYSQTSVFEREALYAVARHAYTGAGEILDIGSAAGGSTYCLAAGLLDSDKKGKVHAFDLFGGFSIKTFAERLAKEGHQFNTDLQFFDWQTRDVSSAIIRIRADLTAHPEVLAAKKVEIAHIDAAKTLSLWKVIFGALAPAVIPGKTIWIFQDFEMISLPWQIYGLSQLSNVGQFIGGARYGTMYFKFKERIPRATIKKIVSDNFSLNEKIEGIDAVHDIIADRYAHLFPGALTLGDLRTGAKAYCHDMAGDQDEARTLFKTLSPAFHSHPAMKGHVARFG